jgi:hypothetical protein
VPPGVTPERNALAGRQPDKQRPGVARPQAVRRLSKPSVACPSGPVLAAGSTSSSARHWCSPASGWGRCICQRVAPYQVRRCNAPRTDAAHRDRRPEDTLGLVPLGSSLRSAGQAARASVVHSTVSKPADPILPGRLRRHDPVTECVQRSGRSVAWASLDNSAPVGQTATHSPHERHRPSSSSIAPPGVRQRAP